mmetsp:Transcript_47956/g.73093  ORF Transcript_47956/g.73093 Transcript_47956/m.73093 type:complete len:93 (-) Transcript_47956:118-396(-)
MDKIPNSDSTKDGIIVKVTNPNEMVEFEKIVSGSGKFSFTSKVGGNYKFCFVTTSSHWIKENKSLRFSIKLVVGEAEINFEDLAKKEHLTGL